MRCQYWISRSFVLLIIVGCSLKLAGQGKIALLMGVGDYPATSKWPSTNAYNDLHLIKESLIQQGVNPEFIYTLIDTACTHARILSAFTSNLIPKLTEGMLVYFHFSGLAQQLKDDSDDEADGYDEAIVPFDAPEKNKETVYDDKSFITDDELESIFIDIRRKIGAKGQLFVTLDASTAPAKSKGLVSARGTSHKMEESSDDYYEFFSAPYVVKDLAPMVHFYSSSFSKLNDEYYSDENDTYGLFTYALCKSMFQISKEANYTEWFEKLRIIMNANSLVQIPVMTGDVDVPAFKGELSGKKEQFDIQKFYSKDLLVMNGGKIDQIEKGTELLLFDDTTTERTNATAIGKGVVERAGLMESEIRILESSIHPIPDNAKLMVSSFHFKPLVIRLQVDVNDSELEQKLLNHFTFSPFIKRDHVNPELLIVKTKTEQLQLRTKQGEVIFQKDLKDTKATEIPFILNEKIAEYLRATFLRNLEFDNDGKNPLLECLISKEGIEETSVNLKNKVKVGSKMKLRITNNSDKGQYFSVIDIQPDHQINVLIPYDQPAESYYLEAGQSYTTDFELEVLPPYGKDVIKVIMLSAPLDLRPVITTRGVSNILDAKVKNPLEILLGNTFIEYPVISGGDMKINVSDIGSMTSIILKIEEIQ